MLTPAEQISQAWRTNAAINLLILDAVPDHALGDTLSKRGGRGVAGEFAHLHNIRLVHLEKRARDLAGGLTKLDPKPHPPRGVLRENLVASAGAVEVFLRELAEGVPKRRGFKRGLFTTLAYFCAHEAHHRGRILLTLKVCGHTLDRKIAMGIWDWDRV